MIDIKMHDLVPEQMPLFEKFQEVGRRNCQYIIDQAVEFIREQHIDPVSGKIHPAVIGLSGGVDSSVVAGLLVRALGVENVIGVMMPYAGMSSKESVADARKLAKKLGITRLIKIPINKAVDSFVKMNESKPGIGIGSYRKGNVMARARMIILYDKAMEFDGRVVDTCNLTEVLVGFFTKYGDGAADHNAIRHVYKTWIWELAKYMKLPERIIEKAPSAELEPNQTDEGDMRITYRALDLFFYLFYEKHVVRGRLEKDYFFSKEIIDVIIGKVKASAHKRNPMPECVLGRLK